MIIDCHCHAGKGDGLRGPWDTAAPLRLYLRRAREAGIDRTVLFPAFHSNYLEANRAVGQIVLTNPTRFLGFAFVHPIRDSGRVRAMVQEAIGRFGFRGLKVHRYDARISREICDVAQMYRLPVLYDVMGEVSTVHLIATEYPEVNFIIPHLGSFADEWAAQKAFLDSLGRYPNVHTDTSGVRRFDLLAEALERAGPDKILFGSDGPWLHPGLELAKVRALKLSATAEQLVLSGNLLRLVSDVQRPDVRAWPMGATQHLASRSSAMDLEREAGDPWRLTEGVVQR